MKEIQKYLNLLINDPFNADHNFNLGIAYKNEHQYAAAISFLLRAAENTTDNLLASESLLEISSCINKQGGRDQKEIYAIKQAITASPTSLEPYLTASFFYSWRGNEPLSENIMNAYIYCLMGINLLENNINEKAFNRSYVISNIDVELYYQKALLSFKLGKFRESYNTYNFLINTYNLSDDLINKMNESIMEISKYIDVL